MNIIKFSVVIFYDDSGELLIQDRRNLGKDAIEWGWFGGRAEGNESSIETALREIQEEISIKLLPNELLYIGKTIEERFLEKIIFEGNIFVATWKKEYESSFEVLEGAGFEWVKPEEIRKRHVYEIQRVHLSMFEEYIKYKNA
ncbi:NUDIX hydrolase [Candidatus Gracilibacteria bacterium]|nr:NUDIX hydrolase [Candidatus Gracilibacteria bacterium]